MWKKILLNVFFNLGIILSAMGTYWCYNNNQPWWLTVGMLAACALFVYLKISLVKDFRKSIRQN